MWVAPGRIEPTARFFSSFSAAIKGHHDARVQDAKLDAS
jgi:hypothetical protein